MLSSAAAIFARRPWSSCNQRREAGLGGESETENAWSSELDCTWQAQLAFLSQNRPPRVFPIIASMHSFVQVDPRNRGEKSQHKEIRQAHEATEGDMDKINLWVPTKFSP